MEANLRAGERGASESAITALSERVDVLERIIVDRQTGLADEIDSLDRGSRPGR